MEFWVLNITAESDWRGESN